MRDLKGASPELIDTLCKCVEMNPYFRLSAKELLKVPLIKENGQKELAGINDKEHRPPKTFLEIDQMGYHGIGDISDNDDERANLPIKQVFDQLLLELQFPLE